MADNYKHENGKATIFKNKYKDTESKPDFKGSGTTLDGKEVEIGGWLGKTKAGEPKISLKMTEPYVKTDTPQPKADNSSEIDDLFK
jgi:uncharacterized protein (DUF736 family)|tara:strand:- start:371 stop:628 length:258 start_codon:yes stop_codon:yes gene_type:complete